MPDLLEFRAGGEVLLDGVAIGSITFNDPFGHGLYGGAYELAEPLRQKLCAMEEDLESADTDIWMMRHEAKRGRERFEAAWAITMIFCATLASKEAAS